MSEIVWAIVIGGFVMMSGFAYYLKSIDDKLDALIVIAHRIRINDREEDWRR